jgi:hypothetical protein
VVTEPTTVRDLLDRADAERSAGRGDAAVALYEEAADLCRASDDLDGWTRAVLGSASSQVFGSEPGRLPAQLHEVYERVTEDGPRARLAAALARCWVYAGEAARAIVFANEAVQRAEQVDDPQLLADSLDAALTAHWGPDDLSDRRRLAARLGDVAAHLLDSDARLKAHMWGLQVAAETLDVPGMHRHMRALERLGEESPVAMFFAASRRLMLDLLRGRTDTADRLCSIVDESLEQAYVPDGWMIQAEMRAYTAVQSGDADTCADKAALGEELALSEGQAVIAAEAAGWWVGAGRLDRARALVRTLEGPVLDELPRDVNWLLTLQVALQVAIAADERGLMEQASRLLAPYEGRAVINAGAVQFHGVTDDPLSRAFDILGEPEKAAQLRRNALATYERIGAQWWRDQLLAWAPAGPEVHPDRLHLHPTGGRLWVVGADGAPSTLPALRGLGYLHQLVRRPGEDVSVIDLVGREHGHASGRQNDLGDVIDDQARDAYRQRLRELDEEIAEAEDWGDAGRLDLRSREREAVLAELRSATGLGGASRISGATTERARVAVRKAIVGALARIADVDPSTARHLRDRVHTGSTCRYEPDPDRPVEWILR